MSACADAIALNRLRAGLDRLDPAQPVADRLRVLVEAGLDRLPLPGHGATLQRWRSLAEVAGRDPALGARFESHADALAILAELGGLARVGEVLAVCREDTARDVVVRPQAMPAAAIAVPGARRDRPGYWHGVAGRAASRYGAALGLAGTARRALRSDPRLALQERRALARIDVALEATAALLQVVAARIDERPLDDGRIDALRVRLAADDCLRRIADHAGRLRGAGLRGEAARFADVASSLSAFGEGDGDGDADPGALGERLLDDDVPLREL